MESSKPRVLLTFDVEEVHQIEAARQRIGRESWASYSPRVEALTEEIAGLLDDFGVRATFFTLGVVARRHPGLVRRLAAAGHEIACHGDMHDRLHRLTPEELKQDLLRSRGVLQDQSGQAVEAYRAPTFSLNSRMLWAIDALIDAGFACDSSIQSIRHPQYGDRLAPRWAYRLHGSRGRWLTELPPLTLQVGPVRLPVAGGGYFRLFPSWLMHAGIHQAAAAGQPAMLYFHPWEFDPDQPRLPLGPVGAWRTYHGLKQTRARLLDLLHRFECGSLSDWLHAPARSDFHPPQWLRPATVWDAQGRPLAKAG